jgi:Kdo2-lipid IVA lauroyltransferase/acyltransferase
MFFIRLISRLPFPILYGISDFLFFVSYYLVGYRRKIVWKNLKNSFPEKTEQELRKIEREFYRNLCDYAVETLKLITIRKEELAKRMAFKNPEVVVQHLAKGQSVLILAAHQFNWEWLLVQGAIVYSVPMDFVYQSVNNKFFDNLSYQTRTRFGAHAIKRQEVAREAVKRKNILRGIAIVADQYPGYGRDKKYTTTFLNQETVFFYGVHQLAMLTQYPIVFYEMKKVKRGYYETTAIEIATPPYAKDSDRVTEAYVRAVEKGIRQNPSGWLWSHNRWKKRHLK